MKVLFIVKSLAHFSYVSSIIKELDKFCKIELLFNMKWSARRPDNVVRFLQQSGIKEYGWTVERKDHTWIFPLREIRSYISYLKRKGQSEFYLKRWHKYLPQKLKGLASNRCIKFLLSHFAIYELLTFIEKRVPSDRGVIEDLKKRNPDVVVVTPINHRFSDEVEYIKAANALSIPTVTTALSWDSLSTKGVFHAIPDLTLVWNEEQRSEAIEIHGVPKDRIRVTGAPFFDKWFEPQLLEDRQFFCERAGLDPKKPYFVYLGSSINIVKDETWLIRKIYNTMRKSERLKNFSMLVRPHPANSIYCNNLFGDGIVVWPKNGSLPEDARSQRNFYNALKHSAFTFGINTSGMIDAVILGKPCLTLVTDRYRDTQRKAVHFRQLVEALEISYSKEQLIISMERVVNGNAWKGNERVGVVEKFVRPMGLDVCAGELAAKGIYEIVHRGWK